VVRTLRPQELRRPLPAAADDALHIHPRLIRPPPDGRAQAAVIVVPDTRSVVVGQAVPDTRLVLARDFGNRMSGTGA
jgi:hypothetical protein